MKLVIKNRVGAGSIDEIYEQAGSIIAPTTSLFSTMIGWGGSLSTNGGSG